MTDTNFIATAALIAVLAAEVAQAQPLERFEPAERRGTKIALGVDEARKLFACKTRISFMQGHGTQVSYTHPDGAIFLWYPGNAVVVTGKWQVASRTTPSQPPREYAAICFQYGSNTYNPVTRQFGGNWQCMPADVLYRLTVDHSDGDVFGLRTRTAVPFRLSPERTTIADLMKQIRSLGAQEVQSSPRPDIACEKGEATLEWMWNG